jgi:tetratricopeptide (TPR) repeat protein
MALLEDLGETEGAARCAGELGAVAFSEGDLARAARLYEQSAHGFTELGDRLRLGIVNANLAEVLALGGELPRAIHHAEQAVAIDRELGDPDGLPVALHTLARLRHKAGQPDAAQHLFAECLACALAIGYREIIANCVQAAADLSLMAGRDPETAARLLTIARATLADIGVRLQGLEAESFAHTEDQLAAKLGRERLEALEREAGEASLEAAAEEAVRLLEAEPLTRWRAPARV